MVSNKFLAGIAALAFAIGAQAAPVSLTSNVSANSHLSQAQGKSFAIDVNSLLSGNSLLSNAITGAQLTVSAYSQAAAVLERYTYERSEVTTETRPKPGNCNKVNCAPVDTIYTDYYTAQYKDKVADTMWVLLGDTWGFDQADLQASTLSDYVRAKDPWYKDGSDRHGWVKAYNSIRTSESSYSGSLSVTLNLDAKALADLTKDGILNFHVYDTWGQFDLTGFKLDLLAQATPTAPAEAQVPVPTSLLLTGLGLAALATARRRRKA